MSNLVNGKVSVVFRIDDLTYRGLDNRAPRRESILLKFMDRLLLRQGDTIGHPAHWDADPVQIEVDGGKLQSESLLRALEPKIKEYSDKRREILGTDRDLRLANLANDEAIYYYHDLLTTWCHREWEFCEVDAAGTLHDARLAEPVDENDPTKVFAARLMLVLNHDPIRSSDSNA